MPPPQQTPQEGASSGACASDSAAAARTAPPAAPPTTSQCADAMAPALRLEMMEMRREVKSLQAAMVNVTAKTVKSVPAADSPAGRESYVEVKNDTKWLHRFDWNGNGLAERTGLDLAESTMADQWLRRMV